MNEPDIASSLDWLRSAFSIVVSQNPAIAPMSLLSKISDVFMQAVSMNGVTPREEEKSPELVYHSPHYPQQLQQQQSNQHSQRKTPVDDQRKHQSHASQFQSHRMSHHHPQQPQHQLSHQQDEFQRRSRVVSGSQERDEHGQQQQQQQFESKQVGFLNGSGGTVVTTENLMRSNGILEQQIELLEQIHSKKVAEDKGALLRVVARYKEKIERWKERVNLVEDAKKQLEVKLQEMCLNGNEEKNTYQKQLHAIESQLQQVQTRYEHILASQKAKAEEEQEKSKIVMAKEKELSGLELKSSMAELEASWREKVKLEYVSASVFADLQKSTEAQLERESLAHECSMRELKSNLQGQLDAMQTLSNTISTLQNSNAQLRDELMQGKELLRASQFEIEAMRKCDEESRTRLVPVLSELSVLREDILKIKQEVGECKIGLVHRLSSEEAHECLGSGGGVAGASATTAAAATTGVITTMTSGTVTNSSGKKRDYFNNNNSNYGNNNNNANVSATAAVLVERINSLEVTLQQAMAAKTNRVNLEEEERQARVVVHLQMEVERLTQDKEKLKGKLKKKSTHSAQKHAHEEIRKLIQHSMSVVSIQHSQFQQQQQQQQQQLHGQSAIITAQQQQQQQLMTGHAYSQIENKGQRSKNNLSTYNNRMKSVSGDSKSGMLFESQQVQFSPVVTKFAQHATNGGNINAYNSQNNKNNLSSISNNSHFQSQVIHNENVVSTPTTQALTPAQGGNTTLTPNDFKHSRSMRNLSMHSTGLIARASPWTSSASALPTQIHTGIIVPAAASMSKIGSGGVGTTIAAKNQFDGYYNGPWQKEDVEEKGSAMNNKNNNRFEGIGMSRGGGGGGGGAHRLSQQHSQQSLSNELERSQRLHGFVRSPSQGSVKQSVVDQPGGVVVAGTTTTTTTNQKQYSAGQGKLDVKVSSQQSTGELFHGYPKSQKYMDVMAVGGIRNRMSGKLSEGSRDGFVEQQSRVLLSNLAGSRNHCASEHMAAHDSSGVTAGFFRSAFDGVDHFLSGSAAVLAKRKHEEILGRAAINVSQLQQQQSMKRSQSFQNKFFHQ